MIDIFVIIIYVLVVLRCLLKGFQWIQNQFNLYGSKTNQHVQAQQVSSQKKSDIKEVESKSPNVNLNMQDIEEKFLNVKIKQVTNQEQRDTKQQMIIQRQVITQEQIINQKNEEIKQTNLIREQSSTNHEILILREQISTLSEQKQSLTLKLQSINQQLQSQKQKSWVSEQQLKSDYEKKIKQTQQRVAKEYLQKLNNQIALKNESSQQSIIVDQKIVLHTKKLQAKVEQLKNELEICQHQLKNVTQNEAHLKEEPEKLNTGSKSKIKGAVSISDIINHPQYLRVKDKLQRYEVGTSSSRPRSILRDEMTPRGDSAIKDSRISQRKSFVSKYSNQVNHQKPQGKDQELFPQCNYLNHDNRIFVLDEIKKIKKLAVKKTKLIFRLDKLHPTNPHQLIDNIPNIIILIELTNKKILAGFSQIAFCKDESQVKQKGSVISSRSRVGSNKSLILDLTNKVAFPNLSNNETIIYDQNALVWGRDELLIKNDQPTLLYSSFGSGEGVYSDGTYPLESFLGGNQEFQRINHYEIHRIYIN